MPQHPSSARAKFDPVDSSHPTNNVDVSAVNLPPDEFGDRIDEEDEYDEQSITELMPEVASNAEFLSDETFTFADTLKAK